jgi:urea transport system ATP-binding protein
MPSNAPSTPLLSIRGVSSGYGESVILHDISFDVQPGQVVCLMGRNGVGKTTLMKTIMGLLKPTRGSLHFAGEEITQAPTSRRARLGLGYVPQGRGIFPYLSVYENLLMGFEARPAAKQERSALEEVYTQFPMLKEFRHRAAGMLSGGQQQQLAFARVLVRRPTLLLLDEPTEGIQPSIMAEIEALIVKLHREQQMSILLVEQFLDFALSVGNAFYVMETGTIVMGGTTAEFDPTRAKEYLAI